MTTTATLADQISKAASTVVELENAREFGSMSDDRYHSNGGYAAATVEINAAKRALAALQAQARDSAAA
jgi:hypothetical protein